MLEILVLRHGQSVADIENRHEGRADFPLTELGRQQARLAAAWIAGNCVPSAIVASPLKRASETAEITAAACGMVVTYDEGLMEFNNGALAGLPYEEAERLYPVPEVERPPHERVPGGESMLEFRFRAEEVWSRLTTQHADAERLLIVAHGGMISMLFRAFARLPVGIEVWLHTGDTGMHLWRVDGTERSILFANRLCHLEGLGGATTPGAP
ncbi:MAG: histidine phosphatase family protein [Chloroflexota bacterium]|nr:histidine phosphatase family protein [Chloroflexota bacterium]MDQ5867431.1 histidine phosphatase family protein [Chloroflexota bacterium]